MRTLLQIVAIGLWRVAGFGLGVLMLYFGALALLHSNQGSVRPLIKWMPEWLLWTLILAAVTIPPAIPAVMGAFGLLPGTGERRVRSRHGFPVEPNQPGK